MHGLTIRLSICAHCPLQIATFPPTVPPSPPLLLDCCQIYASIISYQISDGEKICVVQQHTTEGKRNLFICQITVSHHRIRRSTSLIRKKSMCTLRRLFSVGSWHPKGKHLTKIHTAEKYLLLDLFSCSRSYNRDKKICQKVVSSFNLI